MWCRMSSWRMLISPGWGGGGVIGGGKGGGQMGFWLRATRAGAGGAACVAPAVRFPPSGAAALWPSPGSRLQAPHLHLHALHLGEHRFALRVGEVVEQEVAGGGLMGGRGGVQVGGVRERRLALAGAAAGAPAARPPAAIPAAAAYFLCLYSPIRPALPRPAPAPRGLTSSRSPPACASPPRSSRSISRYPRC
jgi:hypothetical protein